MNTALNAWKDTVKHNTVQKIINAIRTLRPELTSEECLKIYDLSISIHQSMKCTIGKGFESVIENHLHMNNIPFKKQVIIDKDGKIIGTGTIKKGHEHTVDIVVGNEIENGRNINDFIVLSCKFSSRERWREDDWSFKHKPNMYILCTMKSDYPDAVKFQECPNRIIVTDRPKKRDNRVYKWGFDDLLSMLIDYHKY